MWRIRQAEPEDTLALGQIHYQAWIETYTGLIDQTYLDNRSPAKSVAAAERQGVENVLIAEWEGKLVGFARYGKTRDTDLPEGFGEIGGLYLLRCAQKKGLGKAMMQTAWKALQEMGCHSVMLWVLDTNQAAIGFYESCGFRYDGTTKEVMIGTPVYEKRYLMTMTPDPA
ncbi:MAG TPA: GNAT family N-acetyltransferase [Bacillota bacterium]|nr:GNAT family N-acetyltransferase [Bacillota bacterium]